MEILRLAAEGLDNDAIAQALTLSVRTVERHLSNVYAKLDLHGKSARTGRRRPPAHPRLTAYTSLRAHPGLTAYTHSPMRGRSGGDRRVPKHECRHRCRAAPAPLPSWSQG